MHSAGCFFATFCNFCCVHFLSTIAASIAGDYELRVEDGGSGSLYLRLELNEDRTASLVERDIGDSERVIVEEKSTGKFRIDGKVIMYMGQTAPMIFNTFNFKILRNGNLRRLNTDGKMFKTYSFGDKGASTTETELVRKSL